MALALCLFAGGDAVGQQPVAKRSVRASAPPSAFTLAATPVVVTRGNEVQCVIVYTGEICHDVFSGAPGGFVWPAGSMHGYMFNSGPQIFGIVPAGPGCTLETRTSSNSPDCFAWSGDTTGAFFFEPGGVRLNSTPVAGLFSHPASPFEDPFPDAGGAPGFPSASVILDDAPVFHEDMLGRSHASQHDTWAAYWDGDPGTVTEAHVHPMGVLVEQRTLLWNYPDGNEATLFLVFRVTNVTDNPLFQTASEEEYFGGSDRLPDGGWRFDSLHFSYAADPDIGVDAGDDYVTVAPPFDMMLGYSGGFTNGDATYPFASFHEPFFRNAMGMIGMKFVRTPADPVTGEPRGLTSYNEFTGGGAFPVPGSVQRAWRYAARRLDPLLGDPSCNAPPGSPAEPWCFLSQTTSDKKVAMATGPFSLDPGESETIIIAMFAAATVETPLLEVGGDNPPGVPSIAPGCDVPVRAIEMGAGWLGSAECPTGGTRMEQRTVDVVPGSLLGKALVAQAIADHRFMMPQAPEQPQFYLVPGENRVTVVWEPSPTEQNGDPFFPIASDASSVLHDPNFRHNDVEGYRIYRGTSPDNMQLIGQFDRRGTVFRDELCRTDAAHVKGTACTDTHEVPLDADLVQYRTVARAAEGAPVVLDADTALAAALRAGTALPLADNGVPFAFVDEAVRSGFRYYYRVTAFDINSLKSGPSSLESASATKYAVPRSAASSTLAAHVEVGLFGRSRLEAGETPDIDPVTGTFSGPQPPTAQLTGELTVIAGELLSRGTSEIRIDSVVPGYYPNGTIATYHLDVAGDHAAVRFTNRTSQAAPGTVEHVELPLLALESDPEVRARLVQRGVDASSIAAHMTSSIVIDRPHWNSLHAKWAYKQPGFWYSTVADPPSTGWTGGSRWFSGTVTTTPDPTGDILSHGRLDGIAAIFQPTPYLGMSVPAGEARAIAAPMAPYRGLSEQVFRRFYGTVLGVTRAADVQLHWGAAGLDSVIDITHDVPVPFSTAVRASYGFLTDADEDGALTYGDFYYLDGLETSPANEIDEFARAARPLEPQPVTTAVDVDGDLVADGTGFGLYINGEPYLFLGPPPANTVWTLRTYNGAIALSGDGTYSFTPTGSNPAVPGLRLTAIVHEPGDIAGATPDLTRVHTVPDPYYAVSTFDHSPEFKQLQFVNLPAQATIRIYTLSGVLVDVIVHDDASGRGTSFWDMRGRGNNRVSSGVYLFHVSTPGGMQHVGRFTVVASGT